MSRRILARAASVVASAALLTGGAAVVGATSASASAATSVSTSVAAPQALQFYSCAVLVQGELLGLLYVDYYQHVTLVADSVVDAQAAAILQVAALLPVGYAAVSAACVSL